MEPGDCESSVCDASPPIPQLPDLNGPGIATTVLVYTVFHAVCEIRKCIIHCIENI